VIAVAVIGEIVADAATLITHDDMESPAKTAHPPVGLA